MKIERNPKNGEIKMEEKLTGKVPWLELVDIDDSEMVKTGW